MPAGTIFNAADIKRLIVALAQRQAFQAGNLNAVLTLNGLVGDVTLSQGANITLTPSGNDISIAATPGAGGVSSLNALVGGLTIAAGAQITVSAVGTTITIACTAPTIGSVVTYFQQNLSMVYAGAGAPEGVQSAFYGSLYVRDNGFLYKKTSAGYGNTGWDQLL